jgi:hypothetical protein
MMAFKANNLLNIAPIAQYIIHLDNDCFLSDTNELEEYIEEFIAGDYDYACHLVSQAVADQFKSDSHICHVTNQSIVYLDDSGIPSPFPHYENAYQIMKKSMWDRLSVEEVGHHRKFIAALHKQGAKMGAHKASYLWDYTNWGKEWLHIGHIMEKHISLEGSSTQELTKYNKNSDFDRFRAGYFAAQERYYGSKIYSDRMHSRLQIYYAHFGGKDIVLDAWDRICRGTCMENWRVVE